jgi:hypothetical protein
VENPAIHPPRVSEWRSWRSVFRLRSSPSAVSTQFAAQEFEQLWGNGWVRPRQSCTAIKSYGRTVVCGRRVHQAARKPLTWCCEARIAARYGQPMLFRAVSLSFSFRSGRGRDRSGMMVGPLLASRHPSFLVPGAVQIAAPNCVLPLSGHVNCLWDRWGSG